MFLPIAKELWEAMVEIYSYKRNSTPVFDITNKIRKLKQGNTSVTKYFNTLKTLWQELNIFYNFEWLCATNRARYIKNA